MFNDSANALEVIEPEDKTRKEVLGARVDLYMAAKKCTWPPGRGPFGKGRARDPWWISLAYSFRR